MSDGRHHVLALRRGVGLGVVLSVTEPACWNVGQARITRSVPGARIAIGSGCEGEAATPLADSWWSHKLPRQPGEPRGAPNNGLELGTNWLVALLWASTANPFSWVYGKHPLTRPRTRLDWEVVRKTNDTAGLATAIWGLSTLLTLNFFKIQVETS